MSLLVFYFIDIKEIILQKCKRAFDILIIESEQIVEFRYLKFVTTACFIH